MEAEMDEHLGYGNYERSEDREPRDNYRNGTKGKNIRSSYGEFQVDVPQDRNSTFEPQVVKKHQKDISEIDQKIISMYAKGLTTRQISEQIEEILNALRALSPMSQIRYFRTLTIGKTARWMRFIQLCS